MSSTLEALLGHDVDAALRRSVRTLYAGAFGTELRYGNRHVGIEEESIVVKADGTVGSVALIYPLLVELGWEEVRDSVTGTVIGVRKHGVEVGNDVGIGQLEVGFPHTSTLHRYMDRRVKIYRLLDGLLGRVGLRRLRDYSAQPITVPIEEHWVDKGRGNLFKRNFVSAVHAQTSSASSQIHIDVTLEEILPAMEVLLKLAGVIVAFTANSPIWAGGIDPEEMIAARQVFWHRFTLDYGYWHNVLVGPKVDQGKKPVVGLPRSFDDLMQFVMDAPYVVRVEDGMAEWPGMSFGQWLKHSERVSPEVILRELLNHEGTIWWDARPRVNYGTIEVRPAGQNKNPEAHHALALGLVENLEESLPFVQAQDFAWWHALKLRTLRCGMRAEGVADPARMALDIARRGLQKREESEGELLEPLEQRLRDRRSPGHTKLELFRTGGMDSLLSHLLA